MAHREEPIPPVIDGSLEVPDELNSIFRRMVAKDAVDRYQSMSEVIADPAHLLITADAKTGSPMLTLRPTQSAPTVAAETPFAFEQRIIFVSDFPAVGVFAS